MDKHGRVESIGSCSSILQNTRVTIIPAPILVIEKTSSVPFLKLPETTPIPLYASRFYSPLVFAPLGYWKY
jgi:hypothetical protein